MLNRLGGSRICLTALDDVSAVPEPNWMLGVHPDATGRTDGATSAVVIVNDHGGGDVDAFYFYFYA